MSPSCGFYHFMFLAEGREAPAIPACWAVRCPRGASWWLPSPADLQRFAGLLEGIMGASQSPLTFVGRVLGWNQGSRCGPRSQAVAACSARSQRSMFWCHCFLSPCLRIEWENLPAVPGSTVWAQPPRPGAACVICGPKS